MSTPDAPSAAVSPVEEIRARFPALERQQGGHAVAFFDGPGGTQVPRSVVRDMTDYLLHHNANCHWAFGTSIETDAALLTAREALADFVGGDPSEIAFGAHGTYNPSLMSAALDAGINTFCTSGSYMDGREEESVGEGINANRSRRDQIVILTGEIVGPDRTKRSILDNIDASLRRLRTDHIEVFYTGDVRSPEGLRVDALFDLDHSLEQRLRLPDRQLE